MMNRDSQILKAVGGLEAAQKIVERAPYWISYYVADGQFKGQYGSSDGVFSDGFFDDTMTPFPPPHIKLSDLRAAIAHAGSDFVIGDRVVRKSGYIDVFEIQEIDKHEIAHGHTDRGGVGYYLKDLRHATPEEIVAGHRIDEPQILVRPDEAEILPQCAACTTKDHDLKALRKLQASNISIYAGRVHSQQTHILIYEVIIGALIIACVILLLWGLK